MANKVRSFFNYCLHNATSRVLMLLWACDCVKVHISLIWLLRDTVIDDSWIKIGQFRFQTRYFEFKKYLNLHILWILRSESNNHQSTNYVQDILMQTHVSSLKLTFCIIFCEIIKLDRFSWKSWGKCDIHVNWETHIGCENECQANRQSYTNKSSTAFLLEPRRPRQWWHS
jgi:hypothetical protein